MMKKTLSVVLAIALIFLIAGSWYFEQVRKHSAEISSPSYVNKGNIHAIWMSLDTFYLTYHRYPTDDEGLDILVSKELMPRAILRPLDSVQYSYKHHPEKDDFSLCSYSDTNIEKELNICVSKDKGV